MDTKEEKQKSPPKPQEKTASNKAQNNQEELSFEAFMNREDKVKDKGSKRNAAFFLLAMALILALVWFLSDSKKKETAIYQEEEFTTSRGQALPNPMSVENLRAAHELNDKPKRDEKAEALREARIKSAMVIYQRERTAPPSKNSGEPSSTDPNLRFQQELENSSVPVSTVRSLGSLEYKILQGKMLSATLETAVNSDLPGMVRAVLSHNVYGETGRQVLLPRGSRLIGQYNSAIRKGQARVFLVWSRAILPNGHEIMLHSAGTDSLGRTGIRGRVNNHFWQIFGTSALLSVLGATTANVGVDATDQYNSLSAYREEVANSFQETSAQVLDRTIDIPPTIVVRPGTPIKIFVARDLDFSGQFYSAGWERGQSAPWVIRP